MEQLVLLEAKAATADWTEIASPVLEMRLAPLQLAVPGWVANRFALSVTHRPDIRVGRPGRAAAGACPARKAGDWEGSKEEGSEDRLQRAVGELRA